MQIEDEDTGEIESFFVRDPVEIEIVLVGELVEIEIVLVGELFKIKIVVEELVQTVVGIGVAKSSSRSH